MPLLVVAAWLRDFGQVTYQNSDSSLLIELQGPDLYIGPLFYPVKLVFLFSHQSVVPASAERTPLLCLSMLGAPACSDQSSGNYSDDAIDIGADNSPA
jgi:hypothetical protein